LKLDADDRHTAFLSRRDCLNYGLAKGLTSALPCAVSAAAAAASSPPASAIVPRPLVFPRDAGAHPEFTTEWWYVTGYLHSGEQDAAYGFQVTFFRSRVPATQELQSQLAARQLVFAHVAVTDVNGKKMWHDQRIARWSGKQPEFNDTDAASASTSDTNVGLAGWTLRRDGGSLRANIAARNFTLDLRFAQTQKVLLQGDAGLSRKGPDPSQFSYYYSLPQLKASGSLTLAGKSVDLRRGGTAWLDHEWSNGILNSSTMGWDWIGVNMFDGSALTAFQLRGTAGVPVWDGGSFRAGDQRYVFRPGEVQFKPLRVWHSATSRVNYPVEWLVRTPADFYTVKAVVDNQELDGAGSTRTIYWEGLCGVWDSNNRLIGRGYLEMTGYAAPLKL
jgi:predicted secreted hydrolase